MFCFLELCRGNVRAGEDQRLHLSGPGYCGNHFFPDFGGKGYAYVRRRGGLGLGRAVYLGVQKKEERIKLQNIRHPEYEGLQQLITQPEWLPDYGEAKLHPTAGAMPLGVRGPLVAFNVSLNTTDVKIAKKIAQCIREAKGAFAEARAIGVFVEEKQCVQVSCMINHKIVPLYRIIELVRMEAQRYGLSIIGTEVCGMISKEALMDSCAYYMQLEGFDPKAQILEDQL